MVQQCVKDHNKNKKSFFKTLIRSKSFIKDSTYCNLKVEWVQSIYKTVKKWSLILHLFPLF